MQWIESIVQMDWFRLCLRSVLSVVILLLITKVIGYRQISQLTFYDYIIGISMGSISAEMAMTLDTKIHHTLIPLLMYGLLSITLSFCSTKSIHMRRFIVGQPLVLVENGELLIDNLNKAKYDINEFLAECRLCGYFDISDIKFALMENTGQISFLPKEDKRPCTLRDMGITPQQQEGLVANVIIDGQIMQENLTAIGKEKNWLKQQIEQSAAKNIGDILLATCDCNDTFTVYLKHEGKTGPKILI